MTAKYLCVFIGVLVALGVSGCGGSNKKDDTLDTAAPPASPSAATQTAPVVNKKRPVAPAGMGTPGKQ